MDILGCPDAMNLALQRCFPRMMIRCFKLCCPVSRLINAPNPKSLPSTMSGLTWVTNSSDSYKFLLQNGIQRMWNIFHGISQMPHKFPLLHRDCLEDLRLGLPSANRFDYEKTRLSKTRSTQHGLIRAVPGLLCPVRIGTELKLRFPAKEPAKSYIQVFMQIMLTKKPSNLPSLKLT